ncbi:hypothetical protein [Roseomonas sp. BN140053]|uniref:hypothetical protein n=1 Tax=Roseomonas sp. BN140053 TaxID=3391898 RepID=UPI0039EA6C0B
MSAAMRSAPAVDGGAAELAAAVRHCTATESPRELVWLRPTALPPGLDRPHHLKLLRDAASSRRDGVSRVFALPDGDLAVLAPPARPGSPGLFATLRAALDGALPEAELRRVLRPLRLPDEAGAVLVALEHSLGLDAVPAAPPRPPLDPATLAEAERALVQADVWPLHARQDVCRLPAEGGAAELLREDVRPLPAAVADRLLGGRDPAAAPALAARLAEAVAGRLLASLARPDWLGAPRALHLPLPLAGFSSAAFLRLDAALPRSLKPLLCLGVAAAEILDDPDGFGFSRDFARNRGYRLALEAPDPAALAVLPPGPLGVEVVRLPFTAALPRAPGPLPDLARAGAVEVVLAAADSSAAVAWGWQNGVTLFQGRVVQRRRG